MTTTTTHTTKATEKDLATKTMSGIDAHFAGLAGIPLDGEVFTPATLKAVFQDEIDGLNAADAQKIVWQQKVALGRTKVTRARQVRKALQGWVLSTQGAGAVQVLGDLGMEPPKPPGPRTAAAKAQSVAKSKATRAAKKAALATVTTPKAEPAAAPVATAAVVK
jgi:hypothetical protein